LKREQEDGKNAYGRRLQQVTEPIYKEIGAALEEFTKQKGYVMLFDGSKDEKGIILFVDEKSDATKEFIAFCNIKMAGPAKPVTPK
jgi:Outer membrane protein (OmpH-like)